MRTILLKGRGIRKEGITGVAALQPGYIVEREGDGTIIAHETAAGNMSPAVVVENELLGDEITTPYAIGSQVVYEVLPRGAEFLAVLAANAAAIIVGSYLESDGDGTVRILTAAAATSQAARAGVCLRAIEAVDNSAVGVEAFIQVEVL